MQQHGLCPALSGPQNVTVGETTAGSKTSVIGETRLPLAYSFTVSRLGPMINGGETYDSPPDRRSVI